MFRFLEGGMVEICASYPAGEIRTTMDNLRAAAAGEHEEWHDLYPTFADIAEDEGFKEVALMYRAIMVAEQEHEEAAVARDMAVSQMRIHLHRQESPRPLSLVPAWQGLLRGQGRELLTLRQRKRAARQCRAALTNDDYSVCGIYFACTCSTFAFMVPIICFQS